MISLEEAFSGRSLGQDERDVLIAISSSAFQVVSSASLTFQPFDINGTIVK